MKYWNCVILWLLTTCIVVADRLPDFNWDRVPRYMHVRKATAFTSQEIEYLATFPLITFEKTTGSEEFGGTEAGIVQAARAVKAINPRSKILYYRNILVHYGSYAANAQLQAIDDPFLVDRKGRIDVWHMPSRPAARNTSMAFSWMETLRRWSTAICCTKSARKRKPRWSKPIIA